jgi:phosphatidate phosphatase LPIN
VVYDSDDDGDDMDIDGKRMTRERRRSMTSMPGSLDDDMRFDDEGDQFSDNEEMHVPDGEDAAEESFDEDLLAAGEMKNVPFL